MLKRMLTLADSHLIHRAIDGSAKDLPIAALVIAIPFTISLGQLFRRRKSCRACLGGAEARRDLTDDLLIISSHGTLDMNPGAGYARFLR